MTAAEQQRQKGNFGPALFLADRAISGYYTIPPAANLQQHLRREDVLRELYVFQLATMRDAGRTETPAFVRFVAGAAKTEEREPAAIEDTDTDDAKVKQPAWTLSGGLIVAGVVVAGGLALYGLKKLWA